VGILKSSFSASVNIAHSTKNPTSKIIMTQLNGNHLNGNQKNGNQKNGVKQDSPILTKQQKAAQESLINSSSQEFEQSIVLRQSPVWVADNHDYFDGAGLFWNCLGLFCKN
jgi:hypothetical protein